jgi:hypothetical protein
MFIFSPYARKWLLCLPATCLLMLAIFAKPGIYGDGPEYLGMTISIANHFTPDLRDSDISERSILGEENGIGWIKQRGYDGYYKDGLGNYYSYHFWAYPALCAVPYIVLKAIHVNPLMVFQLVNALLLILLIWWILYRAELDYKMQVWLSAAVSFSPVWLYVLWGHPEVYTFTLLSIGLLELLDSRRGAACLFIAAASWQNPPAAVFLLPITASEIHASWRAGKISRGTVLVIMVSSLALLPSAFYFAHYRVSSMIVAKGFASLNYISLSKVVDLFTDLDFGIIVYVPLLIAALVVSLARKDKRAITWTVFILMAAVLITTTGNWNSGMMYINRYGVWMIPPIIMATIGFFERLTPRRLVGAILLYAFSTGAITAYCMKEHDPSNYLRFGPLARAVLSVAPSLYNPPFEVFIERMKGSDDMTAEDFPFVYTDSMGRIIKMVELDGKGHPYYINGDAHLDLSRIKRGRLLVGLKRMHGEDIFAGSIVAGFMKGWYKLARDPAQPRQRWRIDNDAGLMIYMPDKADKIMDITLASFARPRTLVVHLNNEVVYSGAVSSSGFHDIEFPVRLIKGVNVFSITSPEPSQAPCELQINNPDTLKLSFSIERIDLR